MSRASRASAAPRRSAPVAFEVHSAAGLDALRPRWEAIERDLSRPRHSQLFAWHHAYARELAPDPAALRYVLATASGRPVAVAPLFAGPGRVRGLPLRVLAPPAHDHLQLPDLVFERTPENGSLVADLVAFLRTGAAGPWDVLVLPDLLQDSAALFAIEARPPPRLHARPGRACDVLPCENAEARLARMGKNFRSALRGQWSKLSRMPGVEFVRARAPDEVAAALEDFFAVEGSGWKRRAGSAIALDARLTAFYRAVAGALAPRGLVELNLLRLGGRCIAAQYGLRLGRVLYLLKVGYEESHAKLAPGNVLLEHVLRRCTADGDTDAVNLVTASEWHARWAPGRVEARSVEIFAGTLRGRVAHLLTAARERAHGPRGPAEAALPPVPAGPELPAGHRT